MFSLWKGSISLQFIIHSRCNWGSCSYRLTIATHDFRLLSVLPAAASEATQAAPWSQAFLKASPEAQMEDAWCLQMTFRDWALRTAVSPCLKDGGIGILWLSLKLLLHLKVGRASPVHDLQIRNLKHTSRRTCPIRWSRLMRRYSKLDQEYHNPF